MLTSPSMIRHSLETFATTNRQDPAAVVAVRVIELTEVVEAQQSEIDALKADLAALKG